MTYKTYEVTFTVELDDIEDHGNNLKLWSAEYGHLYVPDTSTITELKPVFEPGYFIDMSLPDELRGGAPRYIRWWDYDPNDTDWVRVIVGDRNF